MFKTTKDLTI